MRIIAGEYRSRIILPPVGDTTRPITDRVKQSLFDILMPQIEGATVFDLFAGTGSMGLECLSRGAAKAIFFEADRSAVQILKKNIASLNIAGERYKVENHDLFKLLATWDQQPPEQNIPAGLVFLDPPYRFLRERADDLRALARHLQRHLTAESTVIFRHDLNDSLDLAPLKTINRRDYGQMTIELMRQS